MHILLWRPALLVPLMGSQRFRDRVDGTHSPAPALSLHDVATATIQVVLPGPSRPRGLHRGLRNVTGSRPGGDRLTGRRRRLGLWPDAIRARLATVSRPAPAEPCCEP